MHRIAQHPATVLITALLWGTKMIFYSASSNSFYDDTIHPKIPDDALDISAEEHSALMIAQANGMMIIAGVDGYPTTAPRPEPSLDEKLQNCKELAKEKLQETDWTQLGDVDSALTNAAEFASYRAAVRALFIQPQPEPVWPVKPTAEWI